MQSLLRLSRLIDALNDGVGRCIYWLILVAVVISATNAVVRYALDVSSNAWLEAQWYLFSAVFLLGAGYTLQRNEHVRIDIIAGHLSKRTQAWIDLLGGLLFLLPMSLIIMWLSWPAFIESYARHEISGDAGGLLRWPARLLVPVGFALLSLQGVSEVIKRAAYLAGFLAEPAVLHASPHAQPAATGE